MPCSFQISGAIQLREVADPLAPSAHRRRARRPVLHVRDSSARRAACGAQSPCIDLARRCRETAVQPATTFAYNGSPTNCAARFTSTCTRPSSRDQAEVDVAGVQDAPAALEDALEHRRGVGHRLADHRQHLGAGGLPLQRLVRLVEQPRVLDGDHRLVGEGAAAARPPCRRTASAAAHQHDRADALVLPQHRRRTRPHSCRSVRAARARSAACRAWPRRRAR